MNLWQKDLFPVCEWSTRYTLLYWASCVVKLSSDSRVSVGCSSDSGVFVSDTPRCLRLRLRDSNLRWQLLYDFLSPETYGSCLYESRLLRFCQQYIFLFSTKEYNLRWNNRLSRKLPFMLFTFCFIFWRFWVFKDHNNWIASLSS